MFISYAQNFEDVMLWRALKHVENGLYIDVGAQDPIQDSVSLGFYEKGWRGVHVEASPFYAGMLRAARPDEKVVEMALDREDGEISFYQIADTGLSTGDEEIARKHAIEGRTIDKITVKATTLSKVLDQYVDQDIHWLKIDVEGMEGAVVDGWLPSNVRPWIVVIESTLPNTPQESYQSWEPSLLKIGYDLVYFDGLNRFYVSKLKPELKASFGVGPNVFDDFRLAETATLVVQPLGGSSTKVAKMARSARLTLDQHLVSEGSERQHIEEELLAERIAIAALEPELRPDLLGASQQQVAELAALAQIAHKLKQEEANRVIAEHKLIEERTARVLAENHLAHEKSERIRIVGLLATETQTRVSLEHQLEAEHSAKLGEQRLLAAEQSARKSVENELADEKALLKAVESRIEQLLASRSWRMTESARKAIGAARWFKRGTVAWLTFKPGSRPHRTWQKLSSDLEAMPFRLWSRVQGRPAGKAIKKIVLQVPALSGPLRQYKQKHHSSIQPQAFELAPHNWQAEARDAEIDAARLGVLRIAVVAPTSTNGTAGGAERFYDGLVGAFKSLGHQTDLLAIPFDESSFDTIKQGYQSFSELDLSAYDMVISTKAPSYCIRHPNHVSYLVHTIRVFYDMFEEAFPGADEHLREQRDWIHDTDTRALAAVTRRYSIGQEVSARLRAHNGLEAEVLHPGLGVKDIIPGPVGDYYLIPGRLHRWKRVHLAIEAIKASDLPIRLIVAGAGEAEEELKKLAAGDERIEFAGYVSDEQLAHLYRHALAIIFCPVREDYGYVTLEAFAYAKPVITCTDSGEPLQFVHENVTGHVVSPDAVGLRVAMERLWRDRGAARRMGLEASERVRAINWENVARHLLGKPQSSIRSIRAKTKVAVLDMQPILPAVGGGRLRLLGLYHNLGGQFETRYVGSYDWPGEVFRQQQVSETLKEIIVPLTPAHHKAADEARAKAGGRTVIDMLFSSQAKMSEDYLAETLRAIEWADVVVFSHPWVAPLIDDQLLEGKLVVYDSHNVELRLREQLLDKNDAFQSHVLDQVEAAERLVGDRADLTLACSSEDARYFTQIYDWPLSKIEIVPNGVFAGRILPADDIQRTAAKAKFGFDPGVTVVFFIGSDYAPNVEAANIILDEVAPQCPEIRFVVAGGVCSQLSTQHAGNVTIAGSLSEEDKTLWLQATDIALNPMFSGSGTNIKMFDFAAAGLPIVSTFMGARGIVNQSSYGIDICERDELALAIHRLQAAPVDRRLAGAQNRYLVEDRFAWENLSPQLGQILERELFLKRSLQRKEQNGNPKRVLHFSTVGHKCGIGEYTLQLIGELERQGVRTSIFTCERPSTSPIMKSGEDITVAWYHDTDTYSQSKLSDNIEAMIARSDVDLTIVQHHRGFLPERELERLVDLLHAAGKRVVVIVHSFASDQPALLKRISARGAVVVSHKKKDALAVACDGFRVIHLPLPTAYAVDKEKLEHEPDKSSFTIVSNGFVREHKGFDRLVEAFALVKERVPTAHLRLLCPLYPSADSETASNKIVKAISRFGLENDVDFDTTFWSKSDLLVELSKADLAVFPYAASAEGGSAAAADAIAAGLPLVVSTSEIFDDLRDVAITTNMAPDDLSRIIIEIHETLGLHRELSERTRAYADRTSWNAIANALLGAAM